MQVERDFAGRQIIGTRDEQQDSYAFSMIHGSPKAAGELLIVVADGMGGHFGGREASLTAVDAFVDAFLHVPSSAPEEDPASGADDSSTKPPPLPPPLPTPIEDTESRVDNPPPHPEIKSPCPGEFSNQELDGSALPALETIDKAPKNPLSALRAALLSANAAVDSMIVADPDKFMEAGTTLLAAVVNRHSIQWISVGDSPLLLWRMGKLVRLNADHSMRAAFAAKVAARQMREADIATHPERNALLAVLNGLEISEIDEPPHPTLLQSGDIVIAASDGLLSLNDGDIAKQLNRLRMATADEVVRSLLDQIEKKSLPKQDNTTIAIIKV
jgi:serine/threonine protein phosphatase PrpC